MRYPGGKGGAGVFQTIINQLPPHRVYIEPFVGGGNVFERKAAAASSILADRDPAVAEHWRRWAAEHQRTDVTVRHQCALELLASYPWAGDELVYLDPPYHPDSRKGGDLYRCELDDAGHRALLALLQALPVRWALSGYRCQLYDEVAERCGWRRVDFAAMTRRGPATESLWMNYAQPVQLADYTHVGATFRERERIKRKAHRWVQRFQQLPELERAAIVNTMAAQGLVAPPATAVEYPKTNDT
jgi:site-specific DNA-adenine methylase